MKLYYQKNMLQYSEKKIVSLFLILASTVIVSSKPENIDRETFDLLTYIRLKPTINSNLCKLEFSDSKEFKKKNKKN